MALSKIDSDGIVANGITADSLNIGQIGGRRNLIINGAMQVAQRGTSSTTNGHGSVDRFKVNYSGGTVTQSQESLSSGDPYDLGFRKFVRATNTTAGSTSTSDYRAIYYYMESQDISGSGWNYTSSDSKITLSFWVRSSLAGTYYIQILSQAGTNQNLPIPFTVSADTWTKVTKTISGYSNITINNDSGSGLLVGILPHYGTNYTGTGATDDTWAAYSSGSQTPDFPQNWASTSSATFDLTGVQLEVGDTATPFEHRSYQDEYLACMRYYQIIQEGAGSRDNAGSISVPGEYLIGVGFVYQSNRVMGHYRYIVPMRAIPTGAVSASSDIYCLATGGAWSAASTVNLRLNDRSARLDINGVSLTAGHATEIQINANSNGYLEFDAEL